MEKPELRPTILMHGILESHPNWLVVPGLEPNTGVFTCEVEVWGREVVLHYLFLHQGEIVPRIELVEYLWDQQVFIDDNALSVNITRLRAKLAEIGVCDFIETKRGMGYRI